MSTQTKERTFLTESEQSGVSEFIERIKDKLRQNLLVVQLLGSKATGDFDMESDIDLFILVSMRDYSIMHNIAEIAAEVDLKYDTNISPIIFSVEEHNKNTYFETLFVQNLRKDGIPLYGKTEH